MIENHDVATVAAELGMRAESIYQAKSRCMVPLRSMLKQIEDEEG